MHGRSSTLLICHVGVDPMPASTACVRSFASNFSEELSAKLTAEAKQRVMHLMFSVPKQRYKAMATDFAKICRGEMTADALMAYDM